MILPLLSVPLAWAFILFIIARFNSKLPSALGVLVALSYWLLSGAIVYSLSRPDTHELNIDWVNSLGMNFNMRLEPFQLWFAFLITFIGGCIQLFATSYFAKKEELGRLLITLQIFTFAMLGVVASDNLYTLFLFWELTSVCSFLLVGLHHASAENRRKASQGLLVTMMGGVGLLVAAILLHLEYATVVISELRAREFSAGASSTAAMLLVMLACLTKSAQWPFHFWLPNAMAGPTPVSAFLHSATMVKAGVFLLAVFAPWFGQHSWWTPILLSISLITLCVAYRIGARQNDLKTVLASTTLAALAFLTALAGVGSESALKAFTVLLTAHALYKAPLFLAAGIIEKATGTRSLDRLAGVIKVLPITGAVVTVSMLSLFGLPPLLGFLGKEYLLAALWTYSPLLGVLGALLAASALFVGLRAYMKLTIRQKGIKFTQLHPIPKGMTIACLMPAGLSLLLIGFYPQVNTYLLTPAASSLAVASVKPFVYWGGFQPALFLSVAALLLASLFVFFQRAESKPTHAWADACYERCIQLGIKLGKCVSKWLVVGKLSTHLSVILMSIGVLAFTSLSVSEWPAELEWSGSGSGAGSGAFWILTPLLVASAVIASRAEKVITILVSLGLVGLLVAFIYLLFSAPDLALTQLLAETLVLFLITGSLVKRSAPVNTNNSALRLAIAVVSGMLVTLLVLKSQSVEWGKSASTFFLEKSLPEAFGANVVNVILVDFRALDTFGEIIVLAIAALGVSACLGAARSRAALPRLINSPWLVTSFPLLVGLLAPIALLTLWRGHNAPGGGFIAALMLAILVGTGLLLQHPWMKANNLRKASHSLLVSGLVVAAFAALLPLPFGKPLLAGLWWHKGDLHLGTPLIFDLGVFLTVLGFVINYLRHFLKTSHTEIK